MADRRSAQNEAGQATITKLNNTSSEPIEMALRRLRQGLMTGATKVVGEAHRSLYSAGQQSVPHILASLHSLNLNAVGRGEHIRLAVGLAALLHDVDERSAKEFFDAADKQQVLPAIEAGFRSIRRFTKEEYRRCNHFNIDIFEHKALPMARKSASDYVRSWLAQVPCEELAGISRIYISEEDDSADYFGTYLPALAVINILWDASASRSLISRFLIQRTLYHEIGHHVRRHTLSWQDPEQEEEAEQYAMRMIRRAYPGLRRAANLVRWLRGKPPFKM